VLDLRTKIKVSETSAKDKLTVRQFVQKFNIGKTQKVNDTLQQTGNKKKQCLNFNNGHTKLPT